MIIGPPPKFHGTRDILDLGPRSAIGSGLGYLFGQTQVAGSLRAQRLADGAKIRAVGVRRGESSGSRLSSQASVSARVFSSCSRVRGMSVTSDSYETWIAVASRGSPPALRSVIVEDDDLQKSTGAIRADDQISPSPAMTRSGLRIACSMSLFRMPCFRSLPATSMTRLPCPFHASRFPCRAVHRDVPSRSHDELSRDCFHARGRKRSVSAGAEHAAYVELGTSDTPARPYFAKGALKSANARVPSTIGDAIVKAERRKLKNSRPRFLSPRWRGRVARAVCDSVAEGGRAVVTDPGPHRDGALHLCAGDE